MRVLTFGWDYPPVKNGGLGVACQGLTEELIGLGVEVIFVLPFAQDIDFPGTHIFANGSRVHVRPIQSPLVPYGSSTNVLTSIIGGRRRDRRLLEEVYLYAEKAAQIAEEETFDIIHAHDWVSYLAGVAAKRVSGKPLVLHVHATSYDQAGGSHADPEVFHIEKEAFKEADSIIAISEYTKRVVTEQHGADPSKVTVIHNGGPREESKQLPSVFDELKRQGKKIVLYHGRITIQKGPDYFVRAARRVVDVDPDVVFVMSGWGDMERQIMHMVGGMGLTGHVFFVGPLWDEERDRVYQSADLFVMPSVSEPFGLVALEAIHQGTPVLVSKQSGVSEVLKHALRVDFWDIDEMANKILAAVHYAPLNEQLVTHGKAELVSLSWKRAAEKVKALYHKVTTLFGGVA